MKTISLSIIKKILPSLDLLTDIEDGFVAYSTSQANVPPVGELLMEKGETHIKYGCLKGDEFYVIKIASGFYENPNLGLPSSNGLMLLFSQHTGELQSILLDEGYLTDIRTAVAGAIAARYLAPKKVERIGIIGTGTQARLQLQYLSHISPCKQVLVWGRSAARLEKYQKDMATLGFTLETTLNSTDILKSCNIIVTTTPSTSPLLQEKKLREGTHITAVGSDTPFKQELDPAILKKADCVVGDSLEQCLHRGEIYQAIQSGFIKRDKAVELGNIISGKIIGRTSENQVTVVDLTGVAVQDIKIATAVYNALK